VLKEAERHYEAMITRGTDGSTKNFESLVKRHANDAAKMVKARADIDLVCETLSEFKKLTEQEAITTMYKGERVPISDEKRILLALKLAETISKLQLNHFKLDAASYIHLDEFKIRMPEQIALTRRLLMKVRELTEAKHERMIQRLEEIVTEAKGTEDGMVHFDVISDALSIPMHTHGDEDPVDLTTNEFISGLRSIWSNMEQGVQNA
jgi:hypothetical protein